MAASTIFPTSLAAAKAVGVENVQFAPVAETLPRKILLYGKADPSLEGNTYETEKLYRVTSAEQVGAQFGFGHEIYRLAKWSFAGSRGVETWVVIDPLEAPNGTPTVAKGTIQIIASGVLAGTLHLYISGDYVPVTVNNDDTAEDIENAIVAAINADKTLSVFGSTTAPVADAANIISKDASIYGNYVKITFNEDFGQEFPTGVSATIVQPSGGSSAIELNDLFIVLGFYDEQNEEYFTDLVHSDPDLSSNSLDRLSNWNGVGNLFVGNYGKLVQRPLRCLLGDTTAGLTGFNDLITLGDSRKLDRTNGVIAVPGSPNHPSEIAALALGIAARINNQNAAEGFSEEVLTGVWLGAPEDRWTSSYNSRDQAVKAGISPTVKGKGGTVKLQNLVTFYHPDNVPQDSNGYRSMRAISVLQNISNSVRETFALEKWQRISIVENVENVTSLTARQKVKDKRAVEAEIVALAEAWEANSWIYSASFTIDRIKTGNYVEIRPGGTGFNVIIPVILSGEMWILDSLIQFDTALTVFTQ